MEQILELSRRKIQNFGLGKNYVLQITTILVLISHCVKAHVSLTYPLARTFDLDFLDSIRSKPPCGMPKGNSEKVIKSIII
jgi:hypothetical protein